MKAIMVMYDSLNRHFLEPYGCQWTKTPNFTRLARRALTFDNCYVGSVPCSACPAGAPHRQIQFSAPQLGLSGAL